MQNLHSRIAAVAKGRIRKFASHTGGSVALIFALTIFLLFGFVGGAIDFVRIYRAQAAVQNGIDAAVLAAARAKQLGSTDTDAIASAEAYIAPIKLRLGMDGSIGFAVTDGGASIVAIAKLSQPTLFLKVIGMDKLAINATGTATFGVGSAGQTNVELVMMLDTTGSMAGQKIEDLKAASQDLVDIVVADDQSGTTSRVGIVPFSLAVKLDKNSFEAATGRSYSATNQGCVVERTGSDAYTDSAPANGAYVGTLEDSAPGRSCSGVAEISPLSDKKNDLKDFIRSLAPGNTTAGQIGTAWAWYLLSPNWGTAIDQRNRPAPYSDLTAKNPDGTPKLRKIAVLMTDGAYNTQYSGVDATTQARALCANMKQTGIIVYTVGFDLGGDATSIETLKGCASDESKFYNATTGDALKAAFRDIALKASPLRLMK